MSRLSAVSLLFVLSGLFIITGCETEIDINAPERDVTVIYGILEPNKSTHYIRINHAFIGEESASLLASEPGATEYTDEELTAFIYEFDPVTNNTTRTWQLQSTYLKGKDEGVFFSDSNKVYFFNGTLDVTKYYRIECTVNVEGEDEKTVSAETSLIGNPASSGGLEQVTLLQPRLVGESANTGDRAEVDFIANGDYRQSQVVRWTGVKGGVSYTSYYRFYYTEVDKSTGDRSRDSLLFAIGTKRFSPNFAGNVEYTINPAQFFISIDQQINDYNFGEENFDRIASDTLQYFLEIADNELATYIEVNQPATEILQEQPEYTNINNGIGIFASRLIISTRNTAQKFKSGRVFKSATLEELLYSNQVNPDDSYNTVIKGFSRPGRCNDALRSCR